MAKKPGKKQLQVDALSHSEAKRRNIPTAEFESVMPRSRSIRCGWSTRERGALAGLLR